MKKLKAYRIFEVEMRELQKFLYSTRFAFNKAGTLTKFLKNKDHKQYLEINKFDTNPSGVCSFNRSSILNLEKILNQQTFIRAISALEIFLIDTIRDIFLITKLPFKEQNKLLQFNQAQLLSFKDTSELFNQIINRICRNLSSGGFVEIIKSYKKMLKIDLLNITPGKEKITEYHEMRHLIIHKLGRTDSQFRKKYNIENKAGISIDDKTLEICLKDIIYFAKKTHELVLNKIDELTKTYTQTIIFERQVKYKIAILDLNVNLEFLNANFEFWVNDEFEMLKNILIEKRILSETEIEISLAGTMRQIKAYYSYLKYAMKNNIIDFKCVENIIHSDTKDINIKKRKSKNIQIDDDTLELIRKQLPEQPWEKSVHKKIAEKLGLKNKIVSFAIRTLINKGLYKEQINGVIMENKTKA